MSTPAFFEFFAGGGLVRAGLGEAWRCAFANDIDPHKSAAYRANWGEGELRTADVRALALADVPAITPDLVWASFPCQDLSLAGAGAGLSGARSGAFWPFWRLILDLQSAGRAPNVIALENVCGALTSHGGEDFHAIIAAFVDAGYDVGALVIDAELFVPQSRPRLFIIGVPRGVCPPSLARGADDIWRPRALARAYAALPPRLQQHWIWWNLPRPAARNVQLTDIVEDAPHDAWRTAAETQHILRLMAPLHRKKIAEVQASNERTVGALYRRTRRSADGGPVQRAEVRFDGLAGCLRTPAGGSSRQSLLFVEGRSVRSRLLTAREAARLMGLPDWYVLPARYNRAYRLAGDGVAVPVVKHLSEHLLLPLLVHRRKARRAA